MLVVSAGLERWVLTLRRSSHGGKESHKSCGGERLCEGRGKSERRWRRWLLPGAQPAIAQSSGDARGAQVSNTPQGGFVLKMNGELVLTNVVVRDAKTGEMVQG